jgi:Flp pilus assembly protein TadG
MVRPRLGASDGVALVEFALVLPLFLLIALTGIEYANLAMSHLRVNQIAHLVADNAGRVSGRIDESDINEIFTGATTVGASLSFAANGRIVLSSLQDNGLTGSNHGQMINWQRCTGSLAVNPAYGRQNAGRTNGSLQAMGQTGRQITALPGTAVMFVEVSYTYQPLITSSILGARTITYETAFNVRERTENNITNVQNLTVNSCPT